MRTKICHFLLWLSIAFSITPVYAQECTFIAFNDDCNFGTSKFNVSSTAKAKRISYNARGVININYEDSNMPDSLKIAIKIAANVWSDYMNIGDTLTLVIYYKKALANDIITNVEYRKDISSNLYN